MMTSRREFWTGPRALGCRLLPRHQTPHAFAVFLTHSLIPLPAPPSALRSYMNLPEVQKALHVKTTAWEECSSSINYSGDMPDERKEIYPTLTQKAGYQVLIYNGDADACVPVTDNAWWTASMGCEYAAPRGVGGAATRRRGVGWRT